MRACGLTTNGTWRIITFRQDERNLLGTFLEIHHLLLTLLCRQIDVIDKLQVTTRDGDLLAYLWQSSIYRCHTWRRVGSTIQSTDAIRATIFLGIEKFCL